MSLKTGAGYLLFFVLGVLSTSIGINFALAHGGNASMIHACVGNGGRIRITNASDSCNNNEANLDWAKTRYSFFCGNCDFSGITEIPEYLDSFSNTWLMGAQFYEAIVNGADFSYSYLRNANLQGDFGGVNFTSANLTGASGLSTANTDQTIWSNTICPDGTNSDNNGGTCVGHFIP